MKQTVNSRHRHISIAINPTGPESLSIRLTGRLDASSTGEIWQETVDCARSGKWKTITVESAGLDYVDGTGVGLLVQLKALQIARGESIEIRGLKPKFQQLLDMFDASDLVPPPLKKAVKKRFFDNVGQGAARIFADMESLVSYVGECFASLGSALAHPGRVRWKDVFLLAEKAGIDALPIIGLIGFLMGLIMSFQSAVTLARFGAEIFVADLLGLSMFRELGPLMTTILLASRSGSAFAAEIGTMKVNDEINALNEMGLKPVGFLAVPRVLAAVAMTPLLTLFFIFFSLIGGAVVMLSMGYPLPTYVSRVFSSINMVDFLGGLFKAVVFSLFVAGIACQRGLVTKTGASAVGDSTTSAVVSGIILIAIADGIFAVIYYYLGI